MPKPATEHKLQPTVINLLAKQAKHIHQHKNIKEQLYKTNQSVLVQQNIQQYCTNSK
jgi:hypothetical protein